MADDLVLIARSEVMAEAKLRRWRYDMEWKSMKVNVHKTKFMVSHEGGDT